MVRRLKRDVMAQLPPKRRQVRTRSHATAQAEAGAYALTCCPGPPAARIVSALRVVGGWPPVARCIWRDVVALGRASARPCRRCLARRHNPHTRACQNSHPWLPQSSN
eukprot:362312-Chlamydomonas_euryale.AAC.1